MTRPIYHARSSPFRSPAYVFLFLIWGVSGLLLSLPLSDGFSLAQKTLLLASPILFSLVLTLARPREGFAVWALGLTFLITQTGFQADLGPLRTSALELLLPILLAILLWFLLQYPLFEGARFRLPGQRWLFAFCSLASTLLLLGLLRGDSLSLALLQWKGFFLYPLAAYIMLAGVRSAGILRWSVGLLVGWYALVAARALYQFLTSQGASQPGIDQLLYPFRADANYAPINILAVSLVASALLVLGWSLAQPRGYARLGGILLCAWLVLGALTAVSRTAAVAFLVGLAFLFLMHGSPKGLIVLLLLAAAVMVTMLPEEIPGRLLQIADSSSIRRMTYLETGFLAFRAHWIAGAGWGNGFWFQEGRGLVPTGGVPWYHNDYLNLAVQVGLFALLLYLIFWWRVLRWGVRWLAAHQGRSPFAPYVQGALASLAGILAAALFEHVLWRPDIGGLLGWTLGVLVASASLHRRLVADRMPSTRISSYRDVLPPRTSHH